jgi:hypothetical protein
MHAPTAGVAWINEWLRADALLASAKAGRVLESWPHIFAYWVPVSLAAVGKLKAARRDDEGGGGAGGGGSGSGSAGSGGGAGGGGEGSVTPTPAPPYHMSVAAALKLAELVPQSRIMATDLLFALGQVLQTGLPSHAVQAVLAVQLGRGAGAAHKHAEWSMEEQYAALLEQYHSLRHPGTDAREAAAAAAAAADGDGHGDGATGTIDKDQVLVAAVCGGRQLLHMEHVRQIKAHWKRQDDIAAAKVFAMYSRDDTMAAAGVAAGISLHPVGVLPTALPRLIGALGASGSALLKAARALGAVGHRCTLGGGASKWDVEVHGLVAHMGTNLSLVTKFAEAMWLDAMAHE